jgi:tol-pal system protein YbgF
MRKVFSSGILFLFCFSLLFPVPDKKQKAYELIYKDVQELKRQFLEFNNRLIQNNDTIKGVRQQIDEILKISRLLQNEQLSLKKNQEYIPMQIQILLERLENVSTQLSRLSEDMIEIKNLTLQTPPPPIEGEEGESDLLSKVKEDTVGKQDSKEQPADEMQPLIKPNLSPREVYNMAHSDYLKGSYSLAIDGFKIYLEQFPDSPYADNALYWIGECYFSQREFNSSIEYFKQLVLDYPQGDKVPAAYLKRGISLMELDKKEEALSVFRLLISKFPLEEETRIAQEKIKEIMEK